MKILISATGVSHDDPPRLSGNFYHVFCLVDALQKLGEFEIHATTDSVTQGRFLEVLPASQCHLIGKGGSGKSVRSIVEQDLKLLKLVKELKPAVYHRPTGQLPLFKLANCGTVSTVADLHFKTNRNYGFARRIYKDFSFWLTLRRANQVTAVSEYTASQITHYYRYPAGRITVVHHGVVPRPQGDMPSTIVLRRPYFLTFGQFSHKNCETAIHALSMLRQRSQKEYDLVVVGSNHYIENILKPLVAKLGVIDYVQFAGYVSDNELGALFKNARGLLFLSRFEGFGLPVVEAFFANCPVIAADATSLPEIVGGAGILCDPDDVSSVAQSMLRIDTDVLFREQLISLGRERIKLFSWEQAAIKTSLVYRRLLQNRSKQPS